MKTVKRKANVGECILITNKVYYDNRYENGDVFEVESCGDMARVWVKGVGRCSILPKEYVVIIEHEEANEMPNGIIEKMQAEIAELKSKVAALEGTKVGKMADFSKGIGEILRKDIEKYVGHPTAPTAQQIRDEIVAKAKADVTTWVRLKTGTVCDVEFIVNKEKRTVVVLLKGHRTGDVYEKGIAKADPSDCFNVHIGKAIALRRALGLEVPAEYYNAPAPTEVRVGDVVRLLNIGWTVTATAHEARLTKQVADGDSKIIDDSRE